MSSNRFEMIEKIGQGAYGLVYKALDHVTRQIVAIKTVRVYFDDEGIPSTTLRELAILKSLKHPNIVRVAQLYRFDGQRIVNVVQQSIGGNQRRRTAGGMNDQPMSKGQNVQLGIYSRPSQIVAKKCVDVELIFQFVDEDLSKYIRKNKRVVEHKVRQGSMLGSSQTYGDFQLILLTFQSLFHQLLLAVHFMHKNNVFHRDLKPANILIDKTKMIIKVGGEQLNGIYIVPFFIFLLTTFSLSPTLTTQQLQIADFGLGRIITYPLYTLSKQIQTLWYRSPQILLGCLRYTQSVDVWSLGCILYEMVSGRPLYESDCEIGQLMEIFRINGTPRVEEYPEIRTAPHFKITFPKMKGERNKLRVDRMAARGNEGISSHVQVGSNNNNNNNSNDSNNNPNNDTTPPTLYDPKLFSQQCIDLIERMTTINPNRRITLQDALSHPYFDEDKISASNRMIETDVRMMSQEKVRTNFDFRQMDTCNDL